MMLSYKMQAIQLSGQYNLNIVIMHTHKHINTFIHINSIDKVWKKIQKIVNSVISDSEIANNFFSSLDFSVFSKFSIIIMY